MAQPASINPGSARNNDVSSQHANDNDSHASRSPSAAVPSIQTGQAPVQFIAPRMWKVYLDKGGVSIKYEHQIEQKVQCIRSQRLRRSINIELSNISISKEFSQTRFPYPRPSRNVIEHEPGIEMGQYVSNVGILGMNIGSERRVVNEGECMDNNGPVRYPEGFEKELSFRCKWFEITRSSMTRPEVTIQPTYIVLGIFRRGRSSPDERVVFVDKPEHLFRKLSWAAYRLRDFRGTFFSLTHARGLRVFKCDVKNGTHERVELDKDGTADLQLLFHMYKKWYVSSTTALVWADWIHRTLNDKTNDVPKGTYSLELVLGWSMIRISIVVMFPVLLSLATGIYLNAPNWTDLATIQTAWGTASYVATTGGLVAALLAILSGIEYE